MSDLTDLMRHAAGSPGTSITVMRHHLRDAADTIDRLTRERDEAFAAARLRAATLRRVEALFDRHDAAGHDSVPTDELRAALDGEDSP